MSAPQSQSSTTETFAPLQPPTRYLFGPGPTQVEPRVYQALSKPIVGHLDPYFIQVMCEQQLRPCGSKVYRARGRMCANILQEFADFVRKLIVKVAAMKKLEIFGRKG